MVAKVKFRVDPDLEAIGLYRDPDDDNAPLADPLDHMEDVIFHPALRYCGAVTKLTGTVTLPATVSPAVRPMEVSDHTLAAHGQTGRPMIFGIIKNHPISGADVAWVGSIPVEQKSTFGYPDSYTRWITLSATDTHVVCHHMYPPIFGSIQFGTLDIDYEVYVFNINLDDSAPTGSELKISNASGNMRIETPNGVFDMANRYLRLASSGGIVMPGGRTTRLAFYDHGSPNLYTVTWRCKHGAMDIYSTYVPIGPSGPIGTVEPTSWTPRTEQVDL